MQHDDGAAVRVVGLHQVDARLGEPVGAAEQAAQRLQREVGAREPKSVARCEVGGQRNVLPAQLHARCAVGVEHHDAQVARGHHLPQVGAVELEHRGKRGEGRLAVGRRVGAVGGLVGHGHQFGAEAVAPVDVAQAREGERGGRNQLLRQARAGRQLHCRHVAVDVPVAHLRHRGRARGVAPAPAVLLVAAVKTGDGLLHRVVVVVAPLRLPVFESPVARIAVGEEQVGVSVAGGFQPCVDGLVGGRPVARAAFVRRERHLKPHFRQRRQPLLVGDARGVGQGLAAGLAVAAAEVGVGADHAQHFLRGGAELAGGEHVAAALCEVFGRRDGADLHARAAGCQHCGAQQRREQGLAVADRHGAAFGSAPGRPCRIACEKSASGVLSAAMARSVMRPAARSACMS